MNRRVWPAILVFLAVAIFGSFIAYTQYLFKQVEAEGAISAEVLSLVQHTIVTDSADALNAMFDVQGKLNQMKIPLVVINERGRIVAALNIPDHPEVKYPFTPETERIAHLFATQLAAKNSRNVIRRERVGEVYFGTPEVLRRLKYAPYLQAGSAILLILIIVSTLRADQRAERQRLYAAMARELAHQMGTPLSSLGGWVEVLELPDEERAQMTTTQRIGEVMRADVERLERVSRRFELIGKPQALELLAVSDVIRELEGYFGPRLPNLGTGVHMHTRVQHNLPAVRANRVLLVWAIENVIKNAIDALAGRGGRIMLTAESKRHGEVHIHVADNGPGIEPKVRDRIFDAGVSTKSSGWGVGLALTRRIVEELHHGRVSARGRKRGGTVFDIVLPTADESPEAKKA